MTFSLTERLYSKMVGRLFSSRPRLSIRPPLLVVYSEARNRTPKKVSMFCSMRVWSRFSMSV